VTNIKAHEQPWRITPKINPVGVSMAQKEHTHHTETKSGGIDPLHTPSLAQRAQHHHGDDLGDLRQTHPSRDVQ